MPFNPGELVTVDFPGVTGIKRRLAVILSSLTYHATRLDIIVGLITSQLKGLGATDHLLQDWQTSGLRVASAFRSLLVTLPASANILSIGQLSERDWKAVRACVKIALTELGDPSRSQAQNQADAP